jgi:hypothetical protein
VILWLLALATAMFFKGYQTLPTIRNDVGANQPASLFYATICGLIIYPLLPAAATGNMATLIHALGGVAASIGSNLLSREIANARDKAVGDDQTPSSAWLRDVQDALATISNQIGQQNLT